MTKRAARWWLWGAIGGVIVVYLLSPGPVFGLLVPRLVIGGMAAGPVSFLLKLYAPLIWLGEHVFWVSDFYTWWIGIWSG